VNMLQRLFGFGRTTKGTVQADKRHDEFEARFQAFRAEAMENIAANMIKWQALVEGRERADDPRDIEEAHYWLGQHYFTDGKLDLAKRHSLQALKLRDQLHLFEDEYSRQRYVEWIEKIDRRSE
jgi:hypothetical protein